MLFDVVGDRKTLIDSNYCLNETEAKPSKNGSVFSIDKKAEESHLYLIYFAFFY